MHKITVKRKMNDNVEGVWKILDDYGSVYRYNPGVESSELLSEKKTGLGARRVCHFYGFVLYRR